MTPPPRRARTDRPDLRNATDVHDVLTAGRLTTLEEVDTVRLWKVLRSSQATIRSSTGGGGSGISDPTAQVALGADPTRHALRRVEACVSQMRAAASELAELRRVWLRQGADGATAEPEQALDDGCEVMAAVGVWTPVHRRTKHKGGTIRLSRWAYDWLRETDRLPTREEAERYAQGRRITVPVTKTAGRR